MDKIFQGTNINTQHNLDPEMTLSRWQWFSADYLNSCVPIQDTIHIGGKLRTRLLKREKLMPLGPTIASPKFLEILTAIVSKENHLLRETDLNVHDRMNFAAVSRLCRPEVTDLLKHHVPGIQFHLPYLSLHANFEYDTGSEGLCFYLLMMTRLPLF